METTVSVFVAFKNGVAHVLPQWATRMIEILGAEPAEAIYVEPVRVPEVVVRSSLRTFGGSFAGGSSVKAGLRLSLWQEESRDSGRQPRRSWKRYRDARYRRIATA